MSTQLPPISRPRVPDNLPACALSPCSTPGVLFRAYPGPFQVLINTGEGGFLTVWTGDKFPGHRTVATDILPAAIAERRAKEAARRKD